MKITVNSICAVLCCAVTLCGCVSVPMAPKTDDTSAKSFSVPSDRSNIYIVRRAGYLGGGVAFQVHVDGKLMGSIGPDTFHMATVAPGSHTVGVVSGENAGQVNVTTEPGKSYFFQVQPHMGTWSATSSIKQLPEDEGAKRVQNAKLAKRMEF